MALNTTQKLFIDLERGVAYQAWNNFSQVPTPIFYEDDTAQIELYLVRSTGRGDFPMESVAFPTSTISVSVGTPGAAAAAEGTSWAAISTPAATFSSPTLTVPVGSAIAGSYTLTISNTTPALSEVTTPLTLTSTAVDIQTAILAAIAKDTDWSLPDVSVVQTGAGKFSITAKAKETSTVYTLTIAVTSSLVGPAGYIGSLAFTAAAVDTLLGSATQVSSTLEVQCTDTTPVQTYLQVPCFVRKVVDAIAP
jgi:hypothetical protein